jgi:hypothetical protein
MHILVWQPQNYATLQCTTHNGSDILPLSVFSIPMKYEEGFAACVAPGRASPGMKYQAVLFLCNTFHSHYINMKNLQSHVAYSKGTLTFRHVPLACMHPARQQCNARTTEYLAKLSTRYSVYSENLIVAEIFPNFISLMFKYPVHGKLSVKPFLSQISPVHLFIPILSDTHLHQGLLYDCSWISGPQTVAGPSFVYCHVFGVCVTYRRVWDWWPDLLRTYATCYYTSQTTVWHAVCSPSSSTAILRDSLNFDSSMACWDIMLRPTVCRPVSLCVMHPSGACDQIFITVTQLRVCWCGVLSLTRERVCHLQLLLVLASAVILGSESRGTHDHILLSQIRDFPNLEGQVPVFISPRHWVPFSSPPTTSRATVEVFDRPGILII